MKTAAAPVAPVRPEEISVVIQGPIFGAAHGRLTERVLASVREHLPGAEIILTTWVGSDVAGLDCDRLVTSPDPGGVPHPHAPVQLNNTNRQITSTVAGLRTVTRPFAIKLRTDMPLAHAGFLRFFRRYRARLPEYPVFRERLVIPTIHSINPARSSYLFHPSDFFAFGHTDDVRLLWEVPLAPEPDTTSFFDLYPELNRRGYRERERYVPEQYIWLQCLRKRHPVPYAHTQDYSAEAIRISELALVNNFVLASPEQLGLAMPRHPITLGAWSACYSPGEWTRLYRRLCDPRAPASISYTWPLRYVSQAALELRRRLTGKWGGIRKPARAG